MLNGQRIAMVLNCCAINDISRKINLKLESGKIKIMISKRLKKHIELLMQVIDKLEGEF